MSSPNATDDDDDEDGGTSNSTIVDDDETLGGNNRTLSGNSTSDGGDVPSTNGTSTESAGGDRAGRKGEGEGFLSALSSGPRFVQSTRKVTRFDNADVRRTAAVDESADMLQLNY